jgi:two-component system response regulator RegA
MLPERLLLIIEDDAAFARTLGRSFERRGYEVLLACGYEEARALLQRHSPQYAVVDLKLTGNLSGLACVQMLHAHDAAMLIVVLTGFASIGTAVDAVKLGACQYLAKPSNTDDIETAFGQLDASTDLALTERPTSIKTIEWERIHEVLAATDLSRKRRGGWGCTAAPSRASSKSSASNRPARRPGRGATAAPQRSNFGRDRSGCARMTGQFIPPAPALDFFIGDFHEISQPRFCSPVRPVHLFRPCRRPPGHKADGMVDAKGMTVYTYDKDHRQRGRAPAPVRARKLAAGTCCEVPLAAFYWPSPDDGTKQLAYKGKPLYTFAKDKKAGDKSGDKAMKVWHVVTD